MRCGDYIFEFDPTGFPLVRRRDWNHSISLFPVSKYQFERFMVESGPKGTLYTDSWYREVLALNPRRPWFRCEERPWELFITGLKYDEIEPFLRYLGSRFRLPTEKEWLELLEASSDIKRVLGGYRQQFEPWLAKGPEPVSLWFRKGLFPLVEEGLLEMVTRNATDTRDNVWTCIGKPFTKFYPNMWNPRDTRTVNWNEARRFVGFRLVKEI